MLAAQVQRAILDMLVITSANVLAQLLFNFKFARDTLTHTSLLWNMPEKANSLLHQVILWHIRTQTVL